MDKSTATKAGPAVSSGRAALGVGGAAAAGVAVALARTLVGDPVAVAVVAVFALAAVCVVGWTWYRVQRLKSFERSFKGLPANEQRVRLFAETGRPVPDGISAEQWLEHERGRRYFNGCVIAGLLILLAYSVTAAAWAFGRSADQKHAHEVGRVEAERDARTDEANELRVRSADLRGRLDEGQRRLDTLLARERTHHVRLAGVAGGAATLARLRPDPEVARLTAEVLALLKEFEDSTPAPLSREDDLLVRLSKATVEVVGRRFAAADRLVTEQDANAERQRTEDQKGREARVLAVRAEALVGLHHWERALKCYERLSDLHPDSTRYLSCQGFCLLELRRMRETLAVQDRLLILLRPRFRHGRHEADQEIATAMMNRAVALAEMGDVNGAYQNGRAAVDMFVSLAGPPEPSHVALEDLIRARLRLADILADMGRRDTALDVLAVGAGDIQRLAAVAPQDARALTAALLHDRGVILHEAGRDREAMEVLDRCLTIRDGGEPPDVRAETLLARAAVRFGSDRVAEAAVDLSRAIDLFESAVRDGRGADVGHSLANAYRLRAMVALGRNDFVAALSDTSKAIATACPLLEHNNTPALWYTAAVVHCMYGDTVLRGTVADSPKSFARAADALLVGTAMLRKLKGGSGKYGDTTYLIAGLRSRAELLSRLGRREEARKDIDEAMALLGQAKATNPGVRSIQAKCRLTLGLQEASEGRTAVGIELMNQSVDEYRERVKAGEPVKYEMAYALVGRGKTLYQSGDSDRGRRDFDEAVSLLECQRDGDPKWIDPHLDRIKRIRAEAERDRR